MRRLVVSSAVMMAALCGSAALATEPQQVSLHPLVGSWNGMESNSGRPFSLSVSAVSGEKVSGTIAQGGNNASLTGLRSQGGYYLLSFGHANFYLKVAFGQDGKLRGESCIMKCIPVELKKN